METTLDKKNLISHFIGFIIVLLAIIDVWRYKPTLMLAAALLSIVAFIVSFPLREKGYFLEAILLVTFLLITSFINLFFTTNGWGGSITMLGQFLIAYLYIHSNKRTLTVWVLVSYLTTILFIGYHLFILQTHGNLIYEGLSRNHAGFAVVFWTVFLLFHLKITYHIFPIILPIVGLILSFFLFGRTSLIVSFLLLFLVFFFKFRNKQTMRFILISVFIGFGIVLWYEFGGLLRENTNLGQGLDTPRWKLWSEYLENLNFVNLVTGVDVTQIPLYVKNGENPHNSFIKFHSRIGIGSLVFFVLYAVSIYKYLYQRDYYIVFLLLLITIRAFFDSDILIGNFDFIFLIITFYWIKTNSHES